MHDRVGNQIPHYQLHELLGAAGSLSAFRAFDPRLERAVALLYVDGTTAAEPPTLDTARQATQILADHFRVLDVGTLPAGIFLVLEFAAAEQAIRHALASAPAYHTLSAFATALTRSAAGPASGTHLYPGEAASGTHLYPGEAASGTHLYPGEAASGTYLYPGEVASGMHRIAPLEATGTTERVASPPVAAPQRRPLWLGRLLAISVVVVLGLWLGGNALGWPGLGSLPSQPTSHLNDNLMVIEAATLDQLELLETVNGGAIISWSPEHSLLAINDTTRLTFVELPSFREQRSLQINSTTPLTITFSADWSRYAIASGSIIEIRDVATGTVIHTLAGHNGDVLSMAFAPDAQTLATSAQDQTLILWELATGSLLWRNEEPGAEIVSVAFTPEGLRLTTISTSGKLRLWDAGQGTVLGTFEGTYADYRDHRLPMRSLIVAPDGSAVYATQSSQAYGYQSILWRWALVGEGSGTLATFDSSGSDCLAVSPDGALVAYCWTTPQVSLIKAYDGTVLRSLDLMQGGTLSRANQLSFSPDGRWLAVRVGPQIQFWGISNTAE
ncbi:MAG: protein kinase family protein [Oscillochloridaceae bacterium umkhey_bin13]